MSKVRLFDGIRASFEEALNDECRETTISMPDPVKKYEPAEVAALRNKLQMTQAEFAHLLNVSVKAVESWEQGLRPPSAASARLLQIVQNPDAFSRVVHEREAAAVRSGRRSGPVGARRAPLRDEV